MLILSHIRKRRLFIRYLLIHCAITLTELAYFSRSSPVQYSAFSVPKLSSPGETKCDYGRVSNKRG